MNLKGNYQCCLPINKGSNCVLICRNVWEELYGLEGGSRRITGGAGLTTDNRMGECKVRGWNPLLILSFHCGIPVIFYCIISSV